MDKCFVCGKPANSNQIRISDNELLPICKECIDKFNPFESALKNIPFSKLVLYVMKLDTTEKEQKTYGDECRRKPQKPNAYSYADLCSSKIHSNIELVLNYLKQEPFYDKKTVEILLEEAKMLNSVNFALNKIAIGDENYGKQN